MIHAQSALLRHAQDFFRSDLVGIYSWDHVRIGEPELRVPIAPDANWKERRRQMVEREGRGRYLEQVRLTFGPWELLIYSSIEKPPLGELILRDFESTKAVISGPLDWATWSNIGKRIRYDKLHQKKAS
ncbi:MAG: hypothetical protein WAN93_04060 [Solirubrobacteraceae bacterium]